MPAPVKPTHRTVQAYYQTLQDYLDHKVGHEGALRSAFQNLLAETARPHGWLLVPEQRTKINGKWVVPDGTLQDQFNLHRGFWEAKDTDDDLNVEIKKKADKGYPLTNTIFEDTRRAVLFQNGVVRFEAILTERQQLCDLLNEFYAYTQPSIAGFEQAIAEFRERVPDLGKALVDIVRKAHKDNPKFQAAYAQFFALCQSSLNPNISQDAVA